MRKLTSTRGAQGACARWLLALLLIHASGCGDAGSSAENAPAQSAAPSDTPLVKVILQTDWYPQPEHGGFYLADLAGWYEEVGLDVEIRPGANPGSIPQLVAGNQVQFALGTSDNLIVARGRGVPLIGLFPYFQHDPQCVMFHRESGIRTLADLDGRRVMVNPGATYVAWLQQSLGIRLQLIPLDYSIARFLSDPTFIQQCFLTSEPWYVKQEGIEAGVLPLSSSGFDPYRVVYANADWVANNPTHARAFIAASLRGWRAYADGDTVRVHAVIAELNPGQSLPFMAWTREQMAQFQLIDGNPDRNETLGRVSRARVQDLVQQLITLGLLDSELAADDAFALDLLPPELVAP